MCSANNNSATLGLKNEQNLRTRTFNAYLNNVLANNVT